MPTEYSRQGSPLKWLEYLGGLPGAVGLGAGALLAGKAGLGAAGTA